MNSAVAASTLRQLSNRCLDQPCLVCSAICNDQVGVCSDCMHSLPWQAPGCEVCGVCPPERPATRWQCGDCQSDPPDFRLCRAVLSYEPPVNGLINRLKDRAGLAEARMLGDLLAQAFRLHYQAEDEPLPQLLAPVPLHPQRMRFRGYNQSHLLARTVARQSGVTVLRDSCRRLEGGHSQRGLDATARRANRSRMFAANTRTRLTSHKRVAIIDDVVTTTSTARAMARVLRDAGAGPIDVWALAQVN